MGPHHADPRLYQRRPQPSDCEALLGRNRAARGRGLPLGILPEGRYDEGEVTLAAGDMLVIFTDGVVEAENERELEFGEPRLLDCLRTMQPKTANDALRAILSSVDAFVGRTRQHDDITSLVLLVRSLGSQFGVT